MSLKNVRLEVMQFLEKDVEVILTNYFSNLSQSIARKKYFGASLYEFNEKELAPIINKMFNAKNKDGSRKYTRAEIDKVEEGLTRIYSRATGLETFSNFKLNKSTQKQAEEALMVSLEQKRVNAIVKSFYQNIDVSNAEQVAEADAEAQLFLRNYSLNEGGVRGVNYEVFEDETGRKIGQEIIDGVVKNGINTYNTTKSLNDFKVNSIHSLCCVFPLLLLSWNGGFPTT